MSNLRQLFDQARHNSEQRSYRYATLGKHNPSDDSISYEVPGRADWLYITWPDASPDVARNEAGVPQVEDLEVKLKRDNLGWVIVGRSTKGALTVPTPTPPSGVLPHTIESHSDASISGKTAGDALVWNGTNWVNSKSIPEAVGGTINSASTLSPPVDATKFAAYDSGNLVTVAWSVIKSTLKTYFDTIYTFANIVTDNAITNAKLRDSGALSVIGRSANSSGDPADISATAASGAVLRESGSALGFGTVATAGIANSAVTLAKMANIATDSLIGRDTASSGAPENILLNSTLEMDGSGNLRRAALTGDVTASAGSNATTIANDAVTNAKLANMAALTVKVNNLGISGDPFDMATASGSDQVLRESGGNLGWGTVATGGIADNAITTIKITDAQITLAKMANLAQSTIIGRAAGAGTGVPTALSVAQVVAIINSTLDHGTLAGLSDDDHTQYYNQTRGDARYAQLAAANTFTDNQSIIKTGGAVGAITVQTFRNSNVQSLIQMQGARGTLASPAVVQADDVVGQFIAYGYSAALAGNATLATMRFVVDGTPDSGGDTSDMPGRIEFATSPEGSSTPAIGLVVNNAQQVIAGGLTSAGATWLGVKAGSSSNDAAVGGVLYSSVTTVGNVGSGEDDLMTYAIPGNTLNSNAMSISFEAIVHLTGSGSAKTVRVKYGATTLHTYSGSGGISADIVFTGRIWRTGAATQRAYCIYVAGVAVQSSYTTPAETLSGNVTLKITGEATNTDEITMVAFTVKYDDTNT